MPWTVRESDGQFCVVAKADGKNVGCHGSRDDAMAQVRALYAAEPNMATRIAAEFHGTHRQEDHGNWARNGNGGGTSSPSYDSMTDATEVVDRLKSSGAVNRTDAEWTGSPDADPDNEVIGVINEWINEETNEDSAVGRLQDLGLDPHQIDLDYLATLVEQARGTLTAASKKRKKSTETYADEPWEGTLVVEGTESGDGRLFAYGGLDWAQLPLPLMFQPANSGGHQESIMIGQIEHAARTADKINGWGKVFGQALASEHGPTIRVMMAQNGPGGVSVDVDKVKDADVEMIYAEVEGNPFAKPETTIFHRGRIRGATLVAFPAFVEAKLAFTNQEVVTAAVEPSSCGCSGEPLVAASHTITIPDLPPAHWFSEPTDVKIGGALTITDDGRVFGLVAPSDTTHRNVKTKVPRNLDFSRFHKGETIVEGGSRVVTGIITANCGHAPTAGYGTLQNRIDHYDNSCSVLANVRVGYDRQGAIWVAGALNAGADPRQVAQALGCTLSLDVQPHPDRAGVREFIAAHLVPNPGFPMARAQASVQYNDGLITAAAVPVEYVSVPEARVDMHEVVAMTKMALAQSIGRDPATRKRELSDQLRGR